MERFQEIIPKKLKHINFGKEFNTPWNRNFLPGNVETISFNEKCKFNFNIYALNLPPKLRKISFGYMYDKEINNLPETLEILFFCKNSRFNKFVKKFPSGLKEIYFGNVYNKPLINVPDTVEILFFPSNSQFNSKIIYPAHLKKIYFGKNFNQSLSSLSASYELAHIKFHNNSFFNLPIILKLPSLQSIHFGNNFNNDYYLRECPCLTVIRFSIKSRFNRNIIEMPESLEYLYMGKNFNHEIVVPETIKLIKFPENSKFTKSIHHGSSDLKNDGTIKFMMGKKYREIYK